MGKACGMYGGEENCIQGFGCVTKGKNPFKVTGTNWRIIIRWILKIEDGRTQNGFIRLSIGKSDRLF
jgi:hypothetical protein